MLLNLVPVLAEHYQTIEKLSVFFISPLALIVVSFIYRRYIILYCTCIAVLSWFGGIFSYLSFLFPSGLLSI